MVQTAQIPDRLTRLFGDDINPVPERTAAQIAASRRNGKLSKGPITAAGKARSSQNSTKHGLLAKFIRPADDARGFGQMYQQARKELRGEFRPGRFTSAAIVDALAYDLVQWGRAKKMMESLYPPAALTPAETQQWHTLRKHRQNRRLLRAALAAVLAGESWGLPVAKARKLATCLAELLQAIEEDLAADRNPDLDPLTPEDIEARRPQARMLAAVGTYRRKLADRNYTVAVFTGRQRLQPRQQLRFAAVLTYAATVTDRWLAEHQDLEKNVRQRSETALAAVAKNPERLLLLQRYDTALERSIARKLRLLQKA